MSAWCRRGSWKSDLLDATCQGADMGGALCSPHTCARMCFAHAGTCFKTHCHTMSWRCIQDAFRRHSPGGKATPPKTLRSSFIVALRNSKSGCPEILKMTNPTADQIAAAAARTLTVPVMKDLAVTCKPVGFTKNPVTGRTDKTAFAKAVVRKLALE